MQAIIHKWNKMQMSNRVTAVILACAIVLTALTAIIIPQLNTAEAATRNAASANGGGANDIAGGNLMISKSPLTGGTDWDNYLNNQFETLRTSFKWATVADGTLPTGLPAWTGVAANISNPGNYDRVGTQTNPLKVPGFDYSTNTWEVWSGEQLYYVLSSSAMDTPNRTIKLMRDIDLNGNQFSWKLCTLYANSTIDGNGKTIYNLGATYSGFLDSVRSSTVKNLTFSNVKLVNFVSDGSATSLFYYKNIAWESTFENIKINNSLFYNNSDSNGLGACAPLTWVSGSALGSGGIGGNITNCSVKNTNVYGGMHVGSFAGGNNANVTNCYTTGCSVISRYNHSGGFWTCTDGGMTMKNCFTDAKTYGAENTGAFIGAVGNNHSSISGKDRPSLYENCYSSGSMEGVNNVGGFFGLLEVNKASTITLNNCYSSAIVGMKTGGKNMGGFIGRITSGSFGSSLKIQNCFAVGEVGAIDTDVSAGRTTYKDVGGFYGTSNTTTYITTNSYYDKQTTAMHEWASGTSQSVSGVTGMLTTTSTKSGVGMASGNWNALGASFNNDLGEGYYPQLNVFSNATAADWGSEETANLVKAYSQASVSTVMLDTYDTDYNGTALPKTTYDTVRDVTGKFPLTSDSNLSWARVGVTGQGTLANGTGAKSDAFKLTDSDQTYDVIDLYKYGNEWFGDHPMPGIDWVKSTTTVGGQVGTRALRICPTIGLDAGISKQLAKGSTYDHADDVKLVYSTGSRIAKNTKDFTYGVFPDSPLNSDQTALLNASAYSNTGALVTKYSGAGQDDAFTNIDALYMQRTSTGLSSGVPIATTTAGGKINQVKVSEITSENDDGTVTLGASVDLTDSANADSWNGKTVFSTSNEHHLYSVEYTWSLADGRYIRDTKRIEYPTRNHNVSISVQGINGQPLSNQAYLDAYTKANDDGSFNSALTANLSAATITKDALSEQSHGHAAATAWKWSPTADELIRLQISFAANDGRGTKTVTLDNDELPQNAGESTDFTAVTPYRAYYYDTNGNVAWREVNIEKTYQITLDDTGMYNITFDKKFNDNIDGVAVQDIDMDIEVVLIVNSTNTPKPRSFTVKKTLDAAAEEDELFIFKAEYRGSGVAAGAVQNTMYARITVPAGQTEATATFTVMPQGWYTVTEITSNWQYSFDGGGTGTANPNGTVDETAQSITYWVGAK